MPDRPAGFQYVPNVLLRYGDLRTDDTDAAAAAILGRRYGSAPFGERDVALGQRTLIVGAPGSGKTELLREAGQLLPQGESAILIRCSELDPVSGEPLSVLTSFASRGHGLNREVNVGSESLRQGRFHFFLDGLDEAPLAEQEALAERIVQLAKAFPQHRFTVATRHVEAVTAFPRDDAETATPGEWRVLEVAPDRDWQQRYLTSAGVRLSDLEEEMPALKGPH